MLLLLVLLLAGQCLAQVTTGSLSGYVTDPSDRPIAGADVSVTDATRGGERHVRSDSAGHYQVVELRPGRYSVTASANGFDPVQSDEVSITVNTPLRADFRLPVTGIRQSVEVTSTVRRIPTESAELGLVLDRESLTRLPLNRREFLRLALLSAGVSPPVENSELSARGSFALHALGAREEYNNFLLDGTDNNDHYLNTFAFQPSVDAIEEFKLVTGAYSAQYGRNAGAQVNVVTRGGTNSFHGSLYEYLRNGAMDARNFFDTIPGGGRKLIRNQFGGTAGGRIIEDRTFYFVNIDALRERRQFNRLGVVPATSLRDGDFSALSQPIIDPFTQRPFPGNRIPNARISPVGRHVLDLFPLPNTAGGGPNHLAAPVQRESLTQSHARLDHRLTNRDQLSFRYSYGTQDLFEPFTEELTDLPGFGDFVETRGHNAMVHHTRVISPEFLHSLRLGFSRSSRDVKPENYQVDASTIWNAPWLKQPIRDQGFPLFNVSGYSPVGDATQLPIGRVTDSYHLVEGLSLVHGAHSLKFGAELRHQRMNGFLDYFARGSLSFSGAISGNGLADLLLGYPTFGLQAQFDNRQSLRASSYEFYGEDDWKVSRNLTFNLGLRYELRRPPVDPADRMAIYDPASGRIVNVGTAGFPRSGIRSDNNNLAPRIGLAWTPAPNWVVRTGYGVFYEAGMLVVNSSLYFNPPYFNVRVFFPSAQGLISLDNPFPTNGGITPPASPNTLSPDLTTASLQHWSFNVQRQFGAAFTVSAAYAGSKGTHLVRSRDLNQPRPGPGDVATRRPNPAFGGIFFTESGSNSNYHSLQLSADRRLAKGISILAAYTFSKSIDDTSAFLGTGTDKNFPQDSQNYHAERAVSSYDVPHRFVTAVTWSPTTRAWWLRNTEWSGIATLQSGQPFTPILRFDNSNTGNSGGIFGSDRPNVVGDPKLDSPTPDRWFNTAAFVVAPSYQFGNAGRNIVRGPGIANVDVSLARDFRLHERLRLRAQAQAFNVFNHTQFDQPENFADQPVSFGRIFSAKAPRQLQMALRLEW